MKTLPSIFGAVFLIIALAGECLHAQSADELIRQGYRLDLKLKAAAALELYQQAEKLPPHQGGGG